MAFFSDPLPGRPGLALFLNAGDPPLDRFRQLVLSRGGLQDFAEMYRGFRGRDPAVGPMLKARGLAK